MKHIILATTFFLASFAGNAQQTIVNDANAEKRVLTGSFSAIKVSGGIDVYLSQSGEEAMAVSAIEKEYRDNIKTVVENGTLSIYYDSKKGWGKGNKKLKVYVSFKILERLESSGACDIKVAGTIKTNSLSIGISGASELKGAVDVATLAMDLSGASEVTLSGHATNFTIESSGASDFEGFELMADNCTAKATGASDIEITVNKELNVHASGASEVSYKGACVIKDLHTSGASTVSRKG